MKLKKFGATEQRIYDLVKPITDELGYYLWDVCFEKEGSAHYLRIFIDTDEGISIEDCERVTEPVNKLLDEVDPIKESYVLEVGSAGLERELLKADHFEICEGDKVTIRFIRPVDGEKEIYAYLKCADKNSLTAILEDETEVTYQLSDIAFVKLWLDFDNI